MFIPKVTNEKKVTQLHREKELQMSSANSAVIYLQRPVDPCSLACFEWSSHDFWSVFRFMMSFSCFLDKNFVTPNSFHLSHARTIAASTRTWCDFPGASYCVSLLAARRVRRTSAHPEFSQDLKIVTGLQLSGPDETSWDNIKNCPFASIQAQTFRHRGQDSEQACEFDSGAVFWCDAAKSSRWSYRGFDCDRNTGAGTRRSSNWNGSSDCVSFADSSSNCVGTWSCAPTGSAWECATTGSGSNVDGTSVVTTESAGQRGWKVQTCWASDVRQELRMMAHVDQSSSFPHAAVTGAVSLPGTHWNGGVEGTDNCGVSGATFPCGTGWSGVSGAGTNCSGVLGQLDTDVSSSLHKIIGIGEVKLLSAAAGRVRGRFDGGSSRVHEQIFWSLHVTTRWHRAVHGEHQTSVQVAIALMLLRVERDFCCTSRSLFDVPTTATRVADQWSLQGCASVQPTRAFPFRCLSSITQRLRPGKAVELGSAPCARDLGKHCSWQCSIIPQRSDRSLCSWHHRDAFRECSVSLWLVRGRETLTVWSSNVYGSRSPRPRTHCARAYPLSSMAELQVQVTAAVSTHLTLNSSSSRRARVFQILPCRLTDCVLLWSDGWLSAWVRTPNLRALVRNHARILLLDRKSILRAYAERSDPMFEEMVPHDLRMVAGRSWQQHTIMLAKSRMLMKLNWLLS